jgi:hypothetical protein
MQIRAENDSRFWRKFIVMGVCALGFAGWSLLDGVVNYPAERAHGFEEFKVEMANSPRISAFSGSANKDMTLSAFEMSARPEEYHEWETYCADRGIHSSADVIAQYVMAACASIAGLVLLSFPLRARGRWIESTAEGINSSWGESFRFDEIEVVDKRTWRKKGICKVTYVANGRRSTFVIDDFKFDRWKTDAILYQLEQRIDPGRIENGSPEPEPEPESEVAKVLQKA